MKIYHPQDILTFGKNNGYTLAEIYQYQPNYIEWLIEYKPEFLIDTKEFEQLPKPTPYTDKLKFSETEEWNILPIGPNVIEKLKNMNIEKRIEIDFKFSNKSKKNLEQKRIEEYTCPEWNKSDIGNHDSNILKK